MVNKQGDYGIVASTRLPIKKLEQPSSIISVIGSANHTDA